MKKVYFLILCGMVFCLGCCETNTPNKKADKPNVNEINKSLAEMNPRPGEKVDYDKLRKKANVTEAASMVGYDGKAIKRELNKIIDEREKMDNQLKDLDL